MIAKLSCIYLPFKFIVALQVPPSTYYFQSAKKKG